MTTSTFSLCLIFILQGVTSAETYITKIAPKHGADNGIQHKIVCPYEGSITGVNYRLSSSIDEITFICTSATMGNATFGPFGISEGKPGAALCASNHYISSFYGKAGKKLNRLGIRCRYERDDNGVGTEGGEFGGKNGTNFDDLTLSIGARPISVTVWTQKNETLEGIQVTYGIPTKDRVKWDPNQYKEIEGPRYGYQGDMGNYQAIICPQQGVINGIEYYLSAEGIIMSIRFRCISSLGITTAGPFGSSGGSIKQLNCKDRSHIKYFEGKSDFSHLYELRIKCVASGKDPDLEENGQPFMNNTQNGKPVRSLKEGKFGEVTDFSDEKYSRNGKRPVKIEVWYDIYVNAIQTTYGNMPVAFNCEISKIQVMDELNPEEGGMEVIGIASGSTCSSLQQQLCLTVTEHQSNTTQRDDINSKSTDKRFGRGFTLYGDRHYKFLLSTQFSRIWTKENSSSSISSNSRSETKGLAKAIATTVNYQGPGAAFVIGYRTKYQIDPVNVSVLYHSTCEAGSTPPIPGKVLLQSQTFGKVSFQDYQYQFEPITKCTSEARECIANIKIDDVVYDSKQFETRLKNEFNNCLDHE